MHKSSIEKKYAKRLEKMRVALELSQQEMAEIIGVRLNQYRDLIQCKSAFNAHSLYRLVESTKISYENFEEDLVNYAALSEHKKGNFDFIHPKYLEAAYSKRRVISNILDFSQRIAGPRIREQVNRHFQISNQVWSDPEKTININFVKDVILYLKKQGFSNQDFFNMGRHTIVTARGGPLEASLMSVDTPRKAYELFFSSLVQALEKNCSYSISKIGTDSMLVESRSNPWVAEPLKEKHLGCSEGCLIRAGTISSLTGFIGFIPSEVKEIKCVHRGDTVCRFEVFFPTRRLIDYQ